ncbi:unnamed protein product, partial [Meganyctiphanes norvegica]
MSPNPNNDSGSNLALKHYEESKELESFLKEELSSGTNGDTRCGINSCKPSWMNWLANKFMYFPLHCLVGLQGGCIYSYNVATITTIEKRFKFSSSTIGYIQSGNDISGLLLAVVIAYVADKGNRPRWVGIGVLFSALSCFVGMLPHLVYGAGVEAAELAGPVHNGSSTSLSVFPVKKEELCHSPLDSSCSSESSGSENESYMFAAVLLFLSQLLSGVFPAVFYSVGITFFDDNFDKKTTPLFYAVYQMVRVLGPVLGFILGSRCLALWIDPSFTPDLNLKDPRWLGAWWLGQIKIGGSPGLQHDLLVVLRATHIAIEDVMGQQQNALDRQRTLTGLKNHPGDLAVLRSTEIVNEDPKSTEIPLSYSLYLNKIRYKVRIWLTFDHNSVVLGAVYLSLTHSLYTTFLAKEHEFYKLVANICLIKSTLEYINYPRRLFLRILSFAGSVGKDFESYNILLALRPAITIWVALFDQVAFIRLKSGSHRLCISEMVGSSQKPNDIMA